MIQALPYPCCFMRNRKVRNKLCLAIIYVIIASCHWASDMDLLPVAIQCPISGTNNRARN